MKRIAVSMGDPAGIGPEICVKLLAGPDAVPGAEPIVFGSLAVLRRVADICGLPQPDEKAVLDFDNIDAEALEPGRVDGECGRAACNYFSHAIRRVLHDDFDAVTTAPINKESLRAAGIRYPGHTEMISDVTNTQRSCMLQVSDEVTAGFVTCHCGFEEVPRLMTRERILEVIELTSNALRRLRGRPPRLAVLGLNPHAGEHGLFGNGEEQSVIMPAIDDAMAKGIDVEGPVPPDTAFIPAMRQRVDGFVCMYHDQGHIPLKALAFDRAVNVTLGIPLVRTSVDHGTAFDIAWQGKADPRSLIEAVNLAVQLAE